MWAAIRVASRFDGMLGSRDFSSTGVFGAALQLRSRIRWPWRLDDLAHRDAGRSEISHVIFQLMLTDVTGFLNKCA